MHPLTAESLAVSGFPGKKKRTKHRHIVSMFGPIMVRVARLERAASTSQMWRPTNWATPGYLVVVIITRKSCDSKSFPVCGHLCGQSQFLAQFADPSKSSKRLCCKGFRALAVSIVDEIHNAPKAGALPTALHPVIQLFYPAGRIPQFSSALTPPDIHGLEDAGHVVS